MKQSNNTPKLRFAQFSGDWEQYKVGDFLTESRISGTNGLTAKKLTVKLWGKGVVCKEEIYSGSQATKYYVRKSGQFIYGKLDFLNQAFGIIPNSLDGYESTLDAPAFDISKDLNADFFLRYVLRKEFYLYQGMQANGSRKAKRIHSDTFLEMPIMIPSIAEQTTIGNFFHQLDKLITLHQRKLDNVKTLKKGLLQKMFPQQGETVPQLRFPQFTDAWEQCKLGEVVEISSGYTGDVSLNDGLFALTRIETISNGDVNENKVGYSNEKPNAKYLLNKGDILFSNINSLSHIGKTAIYQNDTKLFHGTNLLRLQSKNKVFPYFLYYQLNTCTKLNWAKSHANQAVNQVSINQTELKRQKLSIPTLTEQTTIGNFFHQLDKLITLHQRKLEHLKTLKKALLQQMFV